MDDIFETQVAHVTHKTPNKTLTNKQVWKGSKDKKDQLEDEASWNKLARFSSFPHFFFIFLFHTWVILFFCQAAVEILGDHEGAMGPVRGHLE